MDEQRLDPSAVDVLTEAGLRSMAHLSVVLFDQDVRICAVHGEAAARHGLIAERLVGRYARDVMSAKRWAQLAPLCTRALTGETVTARVVSGDGARTYETTFQPVRRDEQLIGGMACSREVHRPPPAGGATGTTGERVSELEGLRALRLFETVFARAPVGLCLVALDGRFQRVNDALCRLLGRPASELLSCDFQQVTHPEDLESDLQLLDETLAGHREGYELNKRYLRPDGTVIFARLAVSLVRDQNGEAEFFVSQIVDLTEQHELQEELADWQARTQAILDHSPLAVFLRDLDGRWLSVNRRLAAILGRTAEELDGQSMALTHDQAQQQRFAVEDLEVLADGRAREYDVTFADASRGGELRHYWLQKFPVLDRDGQAIGLGGVSLDVTDREREHRELLVARERFAVAFHHAPVGKVISRLDRTGTASEVISCNPAFADMLGMEAAELIGRAGAMITHPEDLEQRDRLIAAARQGQPGRAEIRLRHRDGHYIWALISPAIVHDADGNTEMIVQALDISDQKRIEQQLRHLADHDALTGLLTRRRFAEELSRECARVRRHGGPASLLLLDLDGFKRVNDTFGHATGDELLVRITGALTRQLREEDVLGRLGGDEFAVILSATGPTGASVVAARLLAAVQGQGHTTRGGHKICVTASIGATALDHQDCETLLIQADLAMYQAKKAGGHRFKNLA
ncbi:MAG: hypothetical protein JWM31_1398 [Solirubrobacterales bacterium]|nr:hypothetical protein [Solirubrobacterales bacterium]